MRKDKEATPLIRSATGNGIMKVQRNPSQEEEQRFRQRRSGKVRNGVN